MWETAVQSGWVVKQSRKQIQIVFSWSYWRWPTTCKKSISTFPWESRRWTARPIDWLEKQPKLLRFIWIFSGHWILVKCGMVISTNSTIALKNLLPFTSTWLCESAFSTLANMKSKQHNRLEVVQDIRCALLSTAKNSESCSQISGACISLKINC